MVSNSLGDVLKLFHNMKSFIYLFIGKKLLKEINFFFFEIKKLSNLIYLVKSSRRKTP